MINPLSYLAIWSIIIAFSLIGMGNGAENIEVFSVI